MDSVKIGNIVIIEDNPDHLELTRDAISEICPGVDVIGLSDGKIAMEYLFGEKGPLKNQNVSYPDLILLDLYLPMVPGLEILKAIRSHREYQTVPVVMFSAQAGPGDIDEAVNLGGNDFILKPLDMYHFTEKLRALMRYWVYVSDL